MNHESDNHWEGLRISRKTPKAYKWTLFQIGEAGGEAGLNPLKYFLNIWKMKVCSLLDSLMCVNGSSLYLLSHPQKATITPSQAQKCK